MASFDEQTHVQQDTEYPTSGADIKTDNSGYHAWVEDDKGDNTDLHDDMEPEEKTNPGGRVNLGPKASAGPTGPTAAEENPDDDESWESEPEPEQSQQPSSGFQTQFSIPLFSQMDHSTCNPATCAYARNIQHTTEQTRRQAGEEDVNSLAKKADLQVGVLDLLAKLSDKDTAFGSGTYVDGIRQESYRQGLKDGSKHSSSSSFYSGVAHTLAAGTLVYGVKSYLSG
ncbi:hypothetical protein M231_07564 [Tremella mesenterica]|uniref:Uncharacterized protein n=1 Tax=Tremella mesenterica TaxID=5217 RepID=A0A4Q1BFR0_TREME|nr:hypothetical protein M231_07564 [Tremella mesenterica]